MSKASAALSKPDPNGLPRIELWGRQLPRSQIDRDQDRAGSRGPTGGPRDTRDTPQPSSPFKNAFFFKVAKLQTSSKKSTMNPLYLHRDSLLVHVFPHLRYLQIKIRVSHTFIFKTNLKANCRHHSISP